MHSYTCAGNFLLFLNPCPRLNSRAIAVIRRPYASHTLVNALDRLLRPPVPLARRVSQQLGLALYLVGVQIPHAYCPAVAIDVVCINDGVFCWPGRNGYLDLWVRGGELGQKLLDEGASLSFCQPLDYPGKIAQIQERATYFMPLELPAQSQ